MRSQLSCRFCARRSAVLGLVAVAWLANEANGQHPNDDQQLLYVHGSSIAERLRAWSSGNQDLQRVYDRRNYEPIWGESPTASADAQLVLGVLRQAENEGLRPQDYQSEELSAMILPDDDAKATFDLRLTDALLRYAYDVKMGRARSVEVESEAGLPSIGFDFAGALAAAIQNRTLESFLRDLASKNPEYVRLKHALARYRAIELAGGWPVLSADSALAGENANALRARLVIEDETAAKDGLTEALIRYQERNGLAPDGVVGARTLAALNIPVAVRIEQIKANMERWRWIPTELEERRIEVNVPTATLQYIDGGTVVLNSKVIVGTSSRRTPTLRSEATAVTVNPVWFIPASIARKEIWPRTRRDPDYLERQGMVVVGGQIRQPPGPQNALGSLKIEMPNTFDVYLHDTPEKSLFQREPRTLSHGCVRVEQIAQLASLAISGDAQFALGDLSEIIGTGKTMRIDLAERIPVYLFYRTTIADDEGHAGFPRDVYGRDPLLLAALGGADSTPRLASADLAP